MFIAIVQMVTMGLVVLGGILNLVTAVEIRKTERRLREYYGRDQGDTGQ